MRPKHIVAASGLVTNSQGQVLLVRTPHRGWEFPGGQVEEGETLLAGLEREIWEEAGVVVTVGQLVGVYSNIAPPVKVIFGFLCEWVSGQPRPSYETSEVAWVTRETALARVTHPAIHDRMQDMLEFSGQITYRVYTTNPYRVIETRFC